MSKETKKAGALLTEKENARAAIIAKATKELEDANAKLTAIEKEIETAQDAEIFKKLIAERRDLEAVKEFCTKKVNEAKSAALTPDEYKAITADVRKSFATLRAETEKALIEEVNKITALLTSMDADVTELNKVLLKAGELTNRTEPEMLNARLIGGGDFITRQYIDIFYRVKYAQAKGVKLT